MSADNYYRIHRVPNGYVVTCEFASDPHWDTTEEVLAKGRGRWFATLAEAQEYAYSEYSEYGVTYAFPVVIKPVAEGGTPPKVADMAHTEGETQGVEP